MQLAYYYFAIFVKEMARFYHCIIMRTILPRITKLRKDNRMKLNLLFAVVLLSHLFAFSQGQIKFITLEYNLSPVSVGQTTSLKIPFSNVGNEPMLITKCQSTNGTSIISSSNKPILPHQSDTLTVRILNNSVGNFKHKFVVGINNQEDSTVLKVTIPVYANYVYGKVVEKKSGEPIAFATVRIDKSEIGTTTDFDGQYALKANVNDTLVFRYTGMKMQKVKVDKAEINIELEEVELKEEVGPPYYPKIKRLEATTTVSAEDIKNADNPKYNFKKNAKNNVFVIYVSELTSNDLKKEDVEFEQKYTVKYSSVGRYKNDYVKKYNWLTFKHLNKKYKKSWRKEIRKDAIGL